MNTVRKVIVEIEIDSYYDETENPFHYLAQDINFELMSCWNAGHFKEVKISQKGFRNL